MGAGAGRPLAVVAVSGGLDSCVAAAVEAQESELALLHAGYGQRTAVRERRAFEEIAEAFGVPPARRLLADLGYLGRIGGSSLTDLTVPVPEGGAADGSIPNTYVPFRNTHLLSVAVSWAEVIRARRVYIGAVEEDSSGYPDCREAYFEAFRAVVRAGTRPGTELEICTPLIRMSKAEIVAKGVELGAPLGLTWSCYRREDLACGTCDSCRLRLRGFRQAGVADPIPYASPGGQAG